MYAHSPEKRPQNLNTQASLSVSGSGNVLQEREDVNGGQSETLEFQSLIRVAGWELKRGCCEMLEMLVA